MSDTRQTIPANGSFYELILALYEQQQQASVLYEDNGVTRANGMISEVFEQEGAKWFRLNDGTEVRIDKLYAVNGTFSSDYSEC